MPHRRMDAVARRWLLKQAKRNLWRVSGWLDLDDLIQDGLLCWQIVCRKYPQVQESRHLMSLFQRTYSNHLHKLANKRTSNSLEETVAELPEVPCQDSELAQFVLDTPGELRQCLSLLLQNPALLGRPHRRYIGGKRQTTNQWLCSLTGLDPSKVDLHGMLNELLRRT